MTTFPNHSVAAPHAHHFASSNERVELSAALIVWYACGTIAAPLVASSLAGMRIRPTRKQRTRYVYVPRTSFSSAG